MRFQPSQHSYARQNSGGKSQNGWPASSSPTAIDIVTVTLANGKTFKATRKAADALKEIAEWWAKNIEPIDTIYGYNYREIRGYEGSGTISNHGSGTAIDINATKHPLGAEGTVPSSRRALITAKAASLGLKWGGDYRNRKDEMHFEVILPPTADMFRKGITAALPSVGKVWLVSAGATTLVLLGLGVASYVKKQKRKKELL